MHAFYDYATRKGIKSYMHILSSPDPLHPRDLQLHFRRRLAWLPIREQTIWYIKVCRSRSQRSDFPETHSDVFNQSQVQGYV